MKSLGRLSPPAAPADAVLLDENLQTTKGSVIAQQLREAGFAGVISILSGIPAEEFDMIQHVPEVDIVFAKGTALVEMAERMRCAHEEKQAARELFVPVTEPTPSPEA